MSKRRIYNELEEQDPRISDLRDDCDTAFDEAQTSDEENVVLWRNAGKAYNAFKAKVEAARPRQWMKVFKECGYARSYGYCQSIGTMAEHWDAMQALWGETFPDDHKAPVQTVKRLVALWRKHHPKQKKRELKPKPAKEDVELLKQRLEDVEAEKARLAEETAKLAKEKEDLAREVENLALRERARQMGIDIPDLQPMPVTISKRDLSTFDKIFQQTLDPGSPTAANATRMLLDLCKRSNIHPTDLHIYARDADPLVIQLKGEMNMKDIRIRALETTIEELTKKKPQRKKAA